MDNLQDGAGAANRPAFHFPGQPSLQGQPELPGYSDLILDTKPLGAEVPAGQLSLSAPADRSDKPHLPVRGDLAHIGLAGRYFVPHYAVPMPHKVTGATPLLNAGNERGEPLRTMAAGEVFDVLDIAGGWAWGQAASDGLVGYVALPGLEKVA